jgi:hypothetical protein
MRCPYCGVAELVDYGYTKECPRCHVFLQAGYQPRRLLDEPDYGFEF